MLCKPCARNHQRRDGGTVGLCWQHVRRRCGVCGGPSAGEELCTVCAHGVDVARWTARAELRTWDTDRDAEFYDARQEKLMQSKFFFHEAVEVLFRGFLGVLRALWGEPPKAEKPEHEEDHREAA